MTKDIVNSLRFSEVLSTRFCHDMAGPISAVSNGLEFLRADDSPEMQEQAFDLLQLSAQESFSKLRMYRMAFGTSVSNGETGVDEIKEIVGQFFEYGKIEMDWPERPHDGFEEKINNKIRQIIVHMLLAVSGIIVFGGKISVKKEQIEGGKRLNVTGTAERFKDDNELHHIMSPNEDDPELSTYNVPFYFMRDLMEEAGMQYSFTLENKRVEFTVAYDNKAV